MLFFDINIMMFQVYFLLLRQLSSSYASIKNFQYVSFQNSLALIIVYFKAAASLLDINQLISSLIFSILLLELICFFYLVFQFKISIAGKVISTRLDSSSINAVILSIYRHRKHQLLFLVTRSANRQTLPSAAFFRKCFPSLLL